MVIEDGATLVLGLEDDPGPATNQPTGDVSVLFGLSLATAMLPPPGEVCPTVRSVAQVILDAAEVTATLARILRARQLLLVLDNCEHLADACAALAATLLRACPGLQILATSRQPLGVTGETTFRVGRRPNVGMGFADVERTGGTSGHF